MTEASRELSQNAEEHLWAAMHARDADERLEHASRGLSALNRESEPDTRVLLLRQAYLAHIERGELQQAVDATLVTGEVGTLRDVVLTDRARVLAVLGKLDDAIESQRLAAQAAPSSRRSFHLWSLALLQQQAGDLAGALETLSEAETWAERDGPMLRAQAAHIRLEAGLPVEDLIGVLDELRQSPAAEGYGSYLLGMIAYQMGDKRIAAVRLRAFLTRNASVDAAKELSLRAELTNARRVLAELESD